MIQAVLQEDQKGQPCRSRRMVVVLCDGCVVSERVVERCGPGWPGVSVRDSRPGVTRFPQAAVWQCFLGKRPLAVACLEARDQRRPKGPIYPICGRDRVVEDFMALRSGPGQGLELK